ncbi:hypothetical protein D915_010471 [Fasciola hepatica]|uniref:ZSWIM3 N-terminal domain-containing protein n=1 Tax=Fasciola hepatica TaxID=6192 RepID=A0A2H1BSQ3_FASHE|nr:hypothetical protein D915_010471 [Fasciola hepatica]
MALGNCSVAQAFSCMMHFPYQTFAKFREDFTTFQQATSTSYSITMCQKASVYFKETGRKLPDHFPYKRLRYVCTHARKRNPRIKIARHEDMNCTAFLSLCVTNGLLALKKGNFVHSHSLQGISPWVYHKNRRLTEEQTEIVHSLMRNSVSTREILLYIEEQFDRKLNRFDLRRIRDKLRDEELSGCVPDIPSTNKVAGDQGRNTHDSNCATSFNEGISRTTPLQTQYTLGAEVNEPDQLDDVIFGKQTTHFSSLALSHPNELNWSDLRQNCVPRLFRTRSSCGSTSRESHASSVASALAKDSALAPNDSSLIRQLLEKPRSEPLRRGRVGLVEALRPS